MNAREQITASVKGSIPEYRPLWLRDEWNLHPRYAAYTDPKNYRTIGSGLEYDPFTDSWIETDKNRDAVLERYNQCGATTIRECKIPENVCNRFLVIPPDFIRQESREIDGDFRVEHYCIPAPKGDLPFAVKFQKNVSTQWMIEEPVKSIDDIEKILSIPFTMGDIDFSDYLKEKELLGDAGVTMIQVDTPLVTVSGLMKFEDYLVMTVTDQALLRELCDIAYERISTILDVCLKAGMGPIFRFNGSEQSTPPMNSPDVYERFIHHYEKKLIKQVHDYGSLAAVHCHGYVRDILPLLLDAEVDMLDPIEAPPSGDITFEEACRIVDGRICLAGNIQLRDLEELSPSEISGQVRSLFKAAEGSRFVLNTTASPLSFVSDRLRDNYLSLIDTWAELTS